MTEQALQAWFAAHPFLRNESILMLGALSGIAKADWDTFKSYRVDTPHAAFSWTVAGFKYAQALLIAGVPPIVAEVWKILGA